MTKVSDIAHRIAEAMGLACDLEIHAFEAGSTKLVSLFADAGLTEGIDNPIPVRFGAPIPNFYHAHSGSLRVKVVNANSQKVVFDDDPYDRPVSLLTLSGSDGGDMVGNRLKAGAGLRVQTVSEWIAEGPLMLSQFAGDDQERLVAAIREAATWRGNAQGHSIQLGRGELNLAAPFNIGNRVTLRGLNKRGSRIKAAQGHAGPFMMMVENGGVSMFDNPIEQLTFDCNNVSGLGGVDSQAWQDGGGLRSVLIEKFRGIGVQMRGMDGGAAFCRIADSEFFGSSQGCVAGIRLNDALASQAFQLVISTTTVAGAGKMDNRAMPRAIDVVRGSLRVHSSHVENCVTGIYLDGAGDHLIEGFRGANSAGGVTNLVEIAPGFTGTLRMRNCCRNGAVNLLRDNRPAGLGTISYDTDVTIRKEPEAAQGAIIASANIDGTQTPRITKGFGISAVQRKGVGDYIAVLTRSNQTANDFSVFATTNMGMGNVRCDLNGVNSVRLRCFDAANNPVDVNELKLLVIRVA
ncbi:MAG TPA: hypothetical protein VN047_18665 [Sphingopyxis sp.]|uniref:hypothetical protein n=1 Tax=Sphingopyxis sp. TaxID=1908224 RepID=UPI002C01E972|nr:hypothetical protein [Sphingopyxis sp.]HWW58923.1 hypothetical protein [Sphingopyxis sp.]